MNFSGVSDKKLLGRVLRLPSRLLPSGASIPVVQGPLRGKRWIVGSSSHGCWLGSYELTKQRAFSAAVKRGDSVFDLGANVGFYSLLASVLVGPEGRVFSFEPVPRNLDFLRAHLKLNRVTNCSVWDVAVGRSEGTAYFDRGLSSSMGHLTSESRGSLKVHTVALDDLVASGELPPPNIIKCDIEGGEYNALKGASETLAKYSPTIFLATHGSDIHRKCCDLLVDFRYRLTTLDKVSLDQASEVLAIGQKMQ
jgi:FkbM family methyltransferase